MAHQFKPINQEYERDLLRYQSDRRKYKGIYPKEETCTFYILVRGKYGGSRRTLDEIYQLLQGENHG